MNYRKAYNAIKRYECNGMCCVPAGDPCMDNCQWVPVLKALKKQIPIRPLKGKGDEIGYYLCPSCKEIVEELSYDSYFGTPNYCPDCGQALDWGDQE